MDPVIHVKNLTKTFRALQKQPGLGGAFKALFAPKYKDIKAVDSISFDIKEGELVGFIGPNGAGKSTTIKMLTGILFPSSGTISVLGLNPQEKRVKLAYDIGTIFGQRQQLWQHLPAIDSFNLFAKIYEIPEEKYKERIKELIDLFNLKEFINTPVRKLSLGQRMRCEFAASLLHRPKVLFLDEPTIGLDIIAKRTMREYIKKVNEQDKTTIILTSHDLNDIEELCERIIVINKGRILYDGGIETIHKRLKYKNVELQFDKQAKPLSINGVKTVSQEPFALCLQVDISKVPVRKVLDAYMNKYTIADIVIEDPAIEEVIERLYR